MLWNHHRIPNDLPQHATIAGSQLGEVPGAVYLGGSAGKTSWRSPLCNSMLRYRTNVIMAKVPGAASGRGETLAQRLLVSLSG